MKLMAMTRPFAEAREALGVTRDAQPQDIRRAYRKAVAVSPPDRDAEAFRRIRDAYELLSDPVARAGTILKHPVPHVPPPPLPTVPSERSLGSVPVELLRAVLGQIPQAMLLGSSEENARPKP
ncbi:MAG: J domain-containing protein [Polyangiaceae bacterium]|jgi:hypothetical protein|nr:J domain-containing protein [Polyangiaceae bacterium]